MLENYRVASRVVLSSIDLVSLLVSYLLVGLPNVLSPSGFSIIILHVFLFSRIHAIWPGHLILFGLTIPVTFVEEQPF
jgi:hypothetical protein